MIDTYADRWALITGASSGIGAAFARRLAELGMHLVLTARRQDLMDELARELDVRHGTKCVVIAADLSEPAEVDRLVEEVASQQISVELLVNNAGFGVVGSVDDTPVDRIRKMTRLNVEALTELTYCFLPEMLQRGHGAIINVASVSGFQPVAYMGAYAATKAYILHFSEALWAELRERGVGVIVLCPGVVRTPFLEIAGAPGWLKKRHVHEPEQVVKSALRALEKGRPYYVLGWRNYLRSLAVRIGTRRRVVLESMKYFRPPPKKPAE